MSGIFAAVWGIAAWVTPDRNFYAFPVIVGLALPLAYRIDGQILSVGAGLGAATAGLINVLIVALILQFAGHLDGPPLVAGVPLLAEAIVLGLIGAGLGFVIATFSPGRER